ncbi:hypothetical protein OEZ60_16440 [Defluviimonas sp. WL0024]|uniref:Transmembrane protein n=2 Tax=Albidovulum TaxID=205889 RepID=A0ABT3J5V6_9RHOB|nr:MULTISPECIES: hypothetical protein [Defluviimonas]MCU9849590.1 hypothetical protein [Defluviimonas sp. WL0024]MCW3783077.1 hypothetical protein [Defluviimonas salinarum]
MTTVQSNGSAVRPTSIGRAVLWIAVALLACLSVLMINGKPLFYFDTMGYVSQGHSALFHIGFPGKSPIHREEVTEVATGKGPDITAEIEADHTVDGSRSTVYSLFAGTLARLGALEGLIALNVAAIFLAVWLPMRIAVRHWGLHIPLSQAVALPIIVASFGSLPFYAAYLMPDTFAPVLILAVATLTVFARVMLVWEILLVLALGSLATVSHLSHLGLATLMAPAAVLVSLIMSRRQWWLPPALVLVIVGMGYAEQSVLRSAARSLSESEVVIKPYITARIIQDGPGMRYLDANCPDEAIPTCVLHEALMHSDDPMRLTASHIVFAQSEELGSLRRLSPEDQALVSDDQIAFFFRVFRNDPFGIIKALAHNVLAQTISVSVDMTLPTKSIVEVNAPVSGLLSGAFEHGRITADPGWLRIVAPLHAVFYALSLAVILILMIVPRRVPGEVKALTVMVLVGILANAMVCGGISQPATRYGARVIWLLPLMATVLMIFARRARRFDPVGEGRL